MKIICPRCMTAWLEFNRYDYYRVTDKFTRQQEMVVQCEWKCINPCCSCEFLTGKPEKPGYGYISSYD